MDVPSKKEKSLEEVVRLNSTERDDLSELHREQNKGKGIWKKTLLSIYPLRNLIISQGCKQEQTYNIDSYHSPQ